MLKTRNLLLLLLCSLLLVSFATPGIAQDKADEADAKADKQEKPKEKSKYKKYEEVITEEAITRSGVFDTHMVGEKLYYEIPEDQFGKEFLWVTQFSKTQTGYSYGGMPVTSFVVRWERRGDNVLLRLVNHNKTAAEDSPINIAVKASSLEAVIGSFKIEAFKDEEKTRPVVDVTSLFTSGTPEIDAKQSLDAAGIDKNRTFVESVKSFPQNIEVRVLATYRMKPPKNPFQAGSPTVSAELHHSMVALPEELMLPRLHDDRIGYFTESFEDYSTTNDELEPTHYITRYRLEKKDPSAEVSEPVKPIVYYVGRGVPERWRKYVKEGIEMWQPAFEQAGFKNAIIAKEPPSVEEDPDWDAEDARYSVIRWLPSTVQNAFGPNVHDPRTGEILEADVRIFHNVIKIARDWYFTRAGASDPRAHKLPFPEDLQGELIRYVVAHEVGHTLGLRHNHKSSQHYTVENLRDPEFTKKYGYMSSIMDYSRFNYVAQPGDGAVLGVNNLFPYDIFAIEWGYREFPGSKTPVDDKPHLDKIAARQMDDPKLIFGSYEEGSVGQADPFARSSDQTGEPVKASTMGMKNLQRIMDYVMDATTDVNDDYDLLKHMHSQLYGQYLTYMTNVAAMIGGVEYNKKVVGQEGAIFEPLSLERQKTAVQYLLDNAFHVKAWLMPDNILRLTGYEGLTKMVNQGYSRLLNFMVSNVRLNRMLDLEVTTSKPYAVADYLADLNAGIFAEISKPENNIPLFRRSLQSIYADLLIKMLKDKQIRPAVRSLVRGALMDVYTALGKVKLEGAETATRYHINDLIAVINEALESDD